MARQDYMKNDDAGKKDLFIHVKNTIATHFGTLGITAATPQVIIQANDAIVFEYVCVQQQRLQGAAQEFTSAKNRLRDGDKAQPNVAVNLAFPTPPSVVPSPVMPGVVFRFRAFVKWLQGLANYTDAIGEDLHIMGPEETSPDLTTLKPVLPLRISGGRVEIDWSWEGAAGWIEAIEIQVDRGTGTYVMLTIDSRPGYVDTEPMPAAPGKWKYKAIFRKDDARIGLWSDVAEIAVG